MSGLFGGTSNSVQQEIYSGVQVSTSILGGCIPYVAGRQRLPFNLLWYGDFTVNTSNSGGGKGGGGSGTKQYSYTTAYIAGICIGPIQGLFQIWHDKALVTLTYENLALALGSSGQAIWSFLNSYTPPSCSFTGYIAGNVLTVLTVTSGSLQPNTPISGSGVASGTKIVNIGGAGGGPGGYVVNIPQTVGSSGSPVSMTGSAGTTGSQAIPYDHIAYVASSSYNLGSTAAMPNLTFEVEGVVPGYSDANSVFDADPSAVWPDYLLDSVHGALAGYPGTPLTIGSTQAPLTGTTNSYQAYCMAMGLLTSPYEDTQRQATDFAAELLQCTNSNCRLSVGILEIIPYCDSAVSATVAGTLFSYTPNLTPVYIFTDDDYCPEKDEPPVSLKQTPLSDTYNEVNIEYLDRSNYYNTSSANCSDLNDQALNGPRLASSLTWHQVTQGNVAKTAGTLWLTRQLYEINTYTFKVRADYALLEPLDYIALNDANLGLVNQVCQITEIEDDANNVLTITALELPGVTRSTAQYNWAGAQGYFANYATDPGPVQTPMIFVMPAIPASLGEGITLGMMAAGESANAAWLGCDVYCSADGGSTYQYVGTIPEACRYGTTTASISAVADPDTTSTLSIALADTQLQISTAVTHADADAMQTLILVGNGSTAEVMSFGTAALTSAGHYNLSYLRRNLYGSVNQSHASGVPFGRLDGAIFQMAVDHGDAGATLNFKFVSFNTWHNYGNQTLASATAYPYTIPAIAVSGAVQLIQRGSCVWDGHNAYKASNGSSAWDSDVVAAAALTAGNVSAQYAVGAKLAVGFVTSTSSTSKPTTNMYAIYAQTGTSVTVVENGTTRYTGSAPASADLYDVRYDGFTLYYYVNGAIVWTTPLQGASLFPAIAEFTPGALFSDVQAASGASATPTQWKTAGTASVNNESLTGGTGTWGGAAAYSITGYSTCHITGKANFTPQNTMLCLSTTPTASASYTNGNYCWFCNGNAWEIYESGTLIGGSLGAVAASDLVSISYDGSTVTYFLNGVSQRTVSISGLTLYGFVAFETVKSGWNAVSFGPSTNIAVVDTSGLGANAATNLAFVVDDATYATTFGGTTVQTTYPGTSFPEPYASSPILNFTATASQEVIVTATGTIYFTNTNPTTIVSEGYIGIVLIDTTNPSANVVVAYSPQAGTGRSFNNISAGASVTTSPSPTQQFAFQFEAAITVEHTYAVVVFCQTAFSQVTAETTSVQLQVETIKR